MSKKLILVLSLSIILSLVVKPVFSQNIQILKEIKDSLISKSELLYTLHYDEEREKVNDEISRLVLKAIKQEKSIDYSFDSIKFISVLTSEDKNLRIFTWVLPKGEGNFECYGYLQSYDNILSTYRSWELKDKSSSIVKPETKVLSADKWFGALYYEMIVTKNRGKKFYTLLGWDANDRISRKKVIDVVTLKKNGEPVFGYNMFSTKGLDFVKVPNGKRIIFEYSAQAKMHLDYERQFVHEKIVPKKKKSKRSKNSKGFIAQKKEVREVPREKVYETSLIIFDRLAANSKELEGYYQFYFPETNIMDGLVFEKGKWKYIPEIDARNPPNGKEVKKKPVNYNLF